MTKLHEIYNEIEIIKKSDLSDFEKMVRIHDNEKKASAETWNLDKNYSLNAQKLHDYAQTQWSDIYLQTDDSTQREFEKFIDNNLKEAEKWSIK